MRRRKSLFSLPDAFRAALPDPVRVDALLLKYDQEGSEAIRQELLTLFACLVSIVTYREYRRLRRRFELTERDLEEMISDASVGLLDAFAHRRSGTSCKEFYGFSQKRIASTIRHSFYVRVFGSRHFAKRDRILSEIKSKLVQRHARIPTRQEMEEELKTVITNGAFCWDRPCPIHESASPELLKSTVASAEPGPDQVLLNKETVRLAMKAIPDATDRKIIKMVLAGHSQNEIAKALGYHESRISQRINGALWMARQNARLAEHAGVEAWQGQPARVASKGLMPVKHLPPALLVWAMTPEQKP